jgi:SAM-dependent methyltransferase
VAALEAGLAQLLGPGERGRNLTLLDVGTGAGDLPRAASGWAARRGITLRGLGVERHRAAARLAHELGVPCVVACGSAMPFRSIDIVLISQLLHHFDDDAAIALIAEACAVARHGVILTDLRPALAAASGFRVAGWALRFHRHTIGDGVTSLARGRTAAALGELARRGGARNITARDLPLARVVVTWRTAN